MGFRVFPFSDRFNLQCVPRAYARSAAFFVVTALQWCQSAPAAEDRLEISCAPDSAVTVSSSNGIARSQIINLDVDRLIAVATAAHETDIRLDLFPDASFLCRPTRIVRRPGGLAIRGIILGESFGRFSLSITDGYISGGIWSQRGVFGLQPAAIKRADGRADCIAIEYRRGSMSRCAWNDAHREADARAVLNLPSSPDSATEGHSLKLDETHDDPKLPSTTQGCDCGDDATRIDVLCVYTSKARDAAGSESALKARVQDALDTATAAMENSNVGGVLINMAGFVQVDYDEQSPDWLDHLKRITEPSDGYMDAVHALRDQYHADTVALFVDDTRFTGGAAWWAHYNAALAFACLNWRGAGSGDLLFAHELGHNFGCAHNREDDASAPYFYAWGYHFDFDGVTYGTIMSYPGDVHIPFYSNPELEYLDVPIGQPLADPSTAAYNSLVIRDTRWSLANFRDSGRIIDCNRNGIDDADDIADQTSADLNGNCRPDECDRRLYVDMDASPGGDGASWETARTELIGALDIASLSCSGISEIWVADGVYLPDAKSQDRWARFSMRDDLAIYGGFQGQSHPDGGETVLEQRDIGNNATILSGDIGIPGDSSDNTYSVVEAIDVSSSAILDGFIIENGNSFADAGGFWCDGASPTIRNCVLRENVAAGSGAALMIVRAGAPQISNTRFEQNSASYYGGAIGIIDSSAPTFTDCIFTENSAIYGGAVWNYNACKPAFARCTFRDNTATQGGGAVETYGDCIATFTDCLIESNAAAAGGGAFRAIDSQLRLIRCGITANTAAFGGALALHNAPTDIIAGEIAENTATTYSGGAFDVSASPLNIVDSLIRENRAHDYGGAAYLYNQSTADIIASTIVQNSSDLGGGIVIADGASQLTNNILWDNSDSSSPVESAQLLRFGGTLTVNYSTIDGWSGSLGGIGNNGKDPQFSDPAVDDFSLAPTSPCIDAADNRAIPADLFDLDGDAIKSEPLPMDLVGNSRFIDAPDTADTGVTDPAHPELPIADRGCFEFSAPSHERGDMNCDGSVDFDDIDAFITALIDRDNYQAELPACDWFLGDIDQNGAVDFDDIDGFVGCLIDGGCP